MNKTLVFTLLISCFLLTSCQGAPDFLKDILLPFCCYLAAIAAITYIFVWLCYKSVHAAKTNNDKEKKKWWLLTMLFSLLVALLVIVVLGQHGQ